MATVKETCWCGAKFEFTGAGWYAEHNVSQAASKWRADHAICRENAIALSDDPGGRPQDPEPAGQDAREEKA